MHYIRMSAYWGFGAIEITGNLLKYAEWHTHASHNQINFLLDIL